MSDASNETSNRIDSPTKIGKRKEILPDLI
jgi:hypothetical protein